MKYISCINKYKTCIEPGLLPNDPPQPPFFCKLVLNDGSVVELEGSGELTRAMVSDQYENTLVSVEIGELCTSISYQAFINCSNLVGITIPNSVTSIGKCAFLNCASLTNIEIPNSVTSIGSGAFQYCSGLTSVTIPNSVISIDSGAFFYCISLISITIGNAVTSIGQGVFNLCINLSTITSYIMNAPSVNGGTFAGVKNNGILYVPIGSTGYDTWMNDQGNLGLYNWTKVEQ